MKRQRFAFSHAVCGRITCRQKFETVHDGVIMIKAVKRTK